MLVDLVADRRDLAVHDATAASFFVLYDVYMLVLTCHLAKAAFSPFRRVLLRACVLLSLVTKLRYALPHAYGQQLPALISYLLQPAFSNDANPADTLAHFRAAAAPADPPLPSSPLWLAVLEYVDTCAILIWVALYIGGKEGHAFAFALTTPPKEGGAVALTKNPAAEGAPTGPLVAKQPSPPPPSPPSCPGRVLCSLSAATLSEGVSSLAIFTVFLTFGLDVRNGDIHPLHSWPMISDLWVPKPSNMISR